MRTARAAAPLALALLVLVATVTAAQEENLGPSGYVAEIESESPGAGEMGEVDAAAAQAEAGTPQAPAPGLRRDAQARVEEIVVQARKRDEFLEDTPVSVTAIGQATLRSANVQRIDQIATLVPNLTFTSRRNVEADVRIRGVGANTGEIAFDPGVGLFIDGVFLSRAFGGILDVLDISQIEVLRGPQGTLFGKNTVGGAVNISTVRPHEDLEGFVYLRPGNLGSINTRIMLNTPIDIGPLEDRVFLRVSLASVNDSGYAFNTYRNNYSSDRNSLTFLGSIRILPLEDVTFDVTGTWSNFHNNGKGGQCVLVQEAGLGGLAPGFFDACRRGEPRRFGANVDNLVQVKSFGTWGTLAWDIGDLGPLQDLELKSITAWRKQLPRRRHDFDMTEIPVLAVSNVGGGSLDGRPGFQQQISQEIQANGRAWDQLTYVLGYFVFWEQALTRSGTAVTAGPVVALTDDSDRIDNWNWAIYGQATWDVTDWLSLSGGLRYTEEKKGIEIVNRLVTDITTDRPPEDRAQNSEIFSAWTPMASIAYTAPEDLIADLSLDHLLAYFTYARGFKGGGFNAVLAGTSVDNSFKPEFLDSFEIGFKTIALEQRLTVNLSLFTAQYDDIQVATLIDVTPPGSETPDFSRVILNAAEATNRGVELEVLALPMDGLQISGNLGYLHARYDSFLGISDTTGLPIDRSGQRLPEVPAFQSFLAVQYSFPVELAGPLWLQGWLTPRLEWAYTSATMYAGPEVPEGTQRGYNLLNARLSYGFLDDRAQVALWAQNLIDEEYFNHANPLVSTFGNIVRYYEPPRTYGAELSYRF